MPEKAHFLHVMEGSYDSTSKQEQIKVQFDESVLMKLKCGNYLYDWTYFVRFQTSSNFTSTVESPSSISTVPARDHTPFSKGISNFTA